MRSQFTIAACLLAACIASGRTDVHAPHADNFYFHYLPSPCTPAYEFEHPYGYGFYYGQTTAGPRLSRPTIYKPSVIPLSLGSAEMHALQNALPYSVSRIPVRV